MDLTFFVGKQTMQKQAKKEVAPELVMDILSRLPTRSMLRFRCVSKLWCNIVGEEHFRNLHSERLIPRPEPYRPTVLSVGFHVLRNTTKGGGTGQSLVSMSFPGSPLPGIIILQHRELSMPGPAIIPYRLSMACNGLLCIVPIHQGMENDPPVFVCNPLTLEYIALPPCDKTYDGVFPPALGYAPFSKQYKLASFSFTNSRGKIRIYTLGAGKPWRDAVDSHVNFTPCPYYQSRLYHDGKIYWFVHLRSDNIGLLSIDMESEKVTLMDDNVPGGIRTGWNPSFKLIVSSRSCGAVAGISVSLFIDQRSNLDVWSLKKANNEWHGWDLRHRVELPDDRPEKRGWRLPGVWELSDGGTLVLLEDMTVVLHDDGRVATVKQLHPHDRHCRYFCDDYNPSLVSLKKYGCLTGEKNSEHLINYHGQLQPPPQIFDYRHFLRKLTMLKLPILLDGRFTV